METLGKRIRKARIDAGVKAARIVESGEASNTAIWLWENDRRVPSPASVKLLGQFFDISHLENDIDEERKRRLNVFETPESAAWRSTQSVMDALSLRSEYPEAITEIKQNKDLMAYPAWRRWCDRADNLADLLDDSVVAFIAFVEKQGLSVYGSGAYEDTPLWTFVREPFPLKYRSHHRGNAPKAKINKTSWRIKMAMERVHWFVGDLDELTANDTAAIYKSVLTKSQDVYNCAHSLARKMMPRKVWENDFIFTYR